MKTRLLPILAVLFLLVPASVLAATTITIPYDDFNSGIVEHPTNYAADTWTVKLVNQLNFTSTSSIAKIFIANSSGAGFFAINVNLAPEVSNPSYYSADFYIATQTDPGPGNWTHLGMLNFLKPGKAYYIRLGDNGTFSVTDGSSVLLTATAVNFPAINIRTDGTDAAISGQVQVTVGGYTLTPTETATAWVPLVIAIAMLSVALGLIERMSK